MKSEIVVAKYCIVQTSDTFKELTVEDIKHILNDNIFLHLFKLYEIYYIKAEIFYNNIYGNSSQPVNFVEFSTQRIKSKILFFYFYRK
jgi:hypothetical protein